MDFFEAQDRAHRTTGRLIALFFAAVASLVALTVGLVAAVIAFQMPPAGVISVDKLLHALSPQLVLGIAGGVAAVVLIASLVRLASLSSGGRSVAEALDGRLVQPNTDDPAERRLRNVVEEMAIASGVPVPPIYVIDEPGINAFAAGYSPDDAVIGITRGALDVLDRTELQGVVAHEFSHVLNGDMRLNLRLVAVLFGILVIGIVGRSLIGGRRGIGTGTMRVRSGSGRGRGTSQTAVLALGLIVIGYLGTFFGGLIKAAVSRQREFLADASAVQFTRDPDGIAGALKKIGGAGARLEAARAEEMSHMFFGQCFAPLMGLMATHPPLEERIRAVEPSWDGRFAAPAPPKPEPEPEPAHERDPVDALHVTDGAGMILTGAVLAGAATASADVGRHLGRITPEDVDHAQTLIGGIPEALHEAAHDPFGARAAIYALSLSPDETVATRQRALVGERAEPGVPDLLDALIDARRALPDASRLPLVHLAMPALKLLSPAQYERFRDLVVDLIKADASLSRFEWILHQVLLKELRPHFEGVRRRRAGRAQPGARRDAIVTLLAALARAGHDDAAGARAALTAGGAAIGIDADDLGDLDAHLGDDPDQARLTGAMRALRDLHPLAVPKVLKAAVACVEHDGVLEPAERDLLQAVAAVLDCPLPPLGLDAPGNPPDRPGATP